MDEIKKGQGLFVVMRGDAKGRLLSFPFVVFPAVCTGVGEGYTLAINVYGELIERTYYWGEAAYYVFTTRQEAQNAADRRNSEE